MDLGRLSAELHDRVIASIQKLAANPRPPGCRKLASCASTACATAGKFIAESSWR
jgi:hypothetical protein